MSSADRNQWQFPKNIGGRVLGWRADGKGLENKDWLDPADALKTSDTGAAGLSIIGSETEADARSATSTFPCVDTLAELKALDTSKDQFAYLKDAVRDKFFVFKTGDYSARTAADTAETIYVAALGVPTTSGAWVWSEWATPISWKEVRYEWFGGVDHPTTDQVPVWNKIVSLKNQMGAEPLRVLVPAAIIALNNGGSDAPADFGTGSNLEIIGQPGATLRKSVAQRILFDFTDYDSLTIEGLTLDGGLVDDTDNDWPIIFVRLGDDVHFIDVLAKDASTGCRIGTSAASAVASKRPKFIRCRAENIKYNGFEAFNTDDLLANDFKADAGAFSGTSFSSRALRILQSHDFFLRGLRVDGFGTALALNTDANRTQENGIIEDFVFKDQTAAAINGYFAQKKLQFIGGKVFGTGTATPIWFGGGAISEAPANPSSEDLSFDNVEIYAGGEETTLARFYRPVNIKWTGGKLEHVGRTMAGSHYAIRAIGASGLVDIRAATVVMDGGGNNGARGLWDISGLSGLKFAPIGNTLYMPNTNQIAQSASSGTLVGTPSSDNTYITYS